MGGSLLTKKGRKEEKHPLCRRPRNLLSHCVLIYQDEVIIARVGPAQHFRFCLKYHHWKAVLLGQNSAKSDCRHQNINTYSYLTDSQNFLLGNGEIKGALFWDTVFFMIIQRSADVPSPSFAFSCWSTGKGASTVISHPSPPDLKGKIKCLLSAMCVFSFSYLLPIFSWNLLCLICIAVFLHKVLSKVPPTPNCLESLISLG